MKFVLVLDTSPPEIPVSKPLIPQPRCAVVFKSGGKNEGPRQECLKY